MAKLIDSVQCKLCNKSETLDKAEEFFYRRKNGRPDNVKTGWHTICKVCSREKKLKYSEKYKIEIAKNKAIYYEQNKERIKAYKKDYYNKTNGKLKSKEKYHKNKEILKVHRDLNKLKKCKTEEQRNALLKRRAIQGLSPLYRRLHDRLVGIKCSSKKRGLTFNLTYDYCLTILKAQEHKCFYSGIVLESITNHPHALSIDRVDSSRGYEEGNVVFCSHLVNLMKHESSPSEFYKLCETIIKFQNEKTNNNRL